MRFYDSQGNIESINFKRAFNHGGCSNVYLSNGIVTKKYYDYTNHCRIDNEVFEYLKGVDNPHFINLIDYYYEVSKIYYPDGDERDIKEVIKQYLIDVYRYYYIKSDDVDILTAPTEYILYNFEEIEKLFKRFAKDKLMVYDMKKQNTVLTKDNIVIIDPDLFCFKDDKKMCKSFNRVMLSYLFIHLFLDNPRYEMEQYRSKIDDLFTFKNETGNLIGPLSKRLSRYKRPIDYLRS